MAVRLYVCGTRGSFPTFGKAYEDYGQATTCYVLREGDYAIVLDCGTGLVNAAEVLRGCTHVDVILSHVHYDHIMGLFVIPDFCPGATLTFFGNFDAWTAVSNKEGKGGSHTFWPEVIRKSPQVAVKPGQQYQVAGGFTVEFAPSTHGDGAFMTRISRDGKILVFTGDYEQLPGNGIEDWVRGCSWLIYDGSYAPEEYPGHEGWGHSTWKQACDLALKCNVDNLLITHYANTHDDASLIHEEKRAREHMKNVTFAREGMCYPLDGEEGETPGMFAKPEERIETDVPKKPEPVCVRAKERDEELKKIAHVGWLRKRCFSAAAINWLICFLSAIATYDMAQRGGEGISASAPFLLVTVIVVISLLMSIFDLNSVDFKEGSFLGRPHWASVALLLEASAAIVLFLTSLVVYFPVMGLRTYAPGGFPGGALASLVVPALILYECIFLEAKAKISVPDLAVVLGILLGLHMITCVAAPAAGLTGILYDRFCTVPGILVYVFMYEGAVILAFFVNRSLLKKGTGYHRAKYREKEYRSVFSTERNCQIFYLILNVMIAGLSLRHVLNTVSSPQLSVFSNPSLISLVLVPVCLISAYYNIRAYISYSVGVYPVWYKCLSYIRMLGTFLNLMTMAVMALAGSKGVAGMFVPYWGGDATVFLFCPILSAIMFFMETREYDINAMIYAVLVMLVVLVISRLAVSIKGFEPLLSLEMQLFYDEKAFFFTIFSEALGGALVFIADRIYVDNIRFQSGEMHVKRFPDSHVELLIAGARGGVAPTKATYYGYGQASNCCCIRDGSYGMILDCGSGLIYANEFLKGCTDVDVFLSDTRFSTVMGLLAAPNPCPGARIRIFGPFGRGTNFENMNGFAQKPLWPVNVIVGECISATPDKDIRLNDLYSVRFQLVPRESGHYILRISGAVGVCYTGPLDTPIEQQDEWANDCDVLICDGHRGPGEAVELSQRCGAGYVLVGNHRSFADDSELAVDEARGREMIPNLSYARQGTVYTIN